MYTYRGSWCSEGASTSWEGDWRTVGEKGTAIWHNENIYAEILDENSSQEFMNKVIRIEPKSSWNGKEGHFGCLDDMFDSILNKREPQTVCSDNIHSLEMVFAAVESAKSGKKVTLV